MKQASTSQDTFYIGWQDQAAADIAQKQRRFVWIVALSLVAAGLLLASQQKGFSTTFFDFGNTTTLEGILVMEPYPSLFLPNEDYVTQTYFKQVLLVGFGKFGAKGALLEAAQQQNKDIDARFVKLRGTLLYGDGKTLLELTDGAASVLEIGAPSNAIAEIRPFDQGEQELRGEILDVKCYFGVMKPGEGKPHRSCAARCIAGGIPPAMAAPTADGGTTYFLLLGPDGGMINDRLADYAGRPVALCGRVEQVHDWNLFYLNERNGLHPLANDIPPGMAPCN